MTTIPTKEEQIIIWENCFSHHSQECHKCGDWLCCDNNQVPQELKEKLDCQHNVPSRHDRFCLKCSYSTCRNHPSNQKEDEQFSTVSIKSRYDYPSHASFSFEVGLWHLTNAIDSLIEKLSRYSTFPVLPISPEDEKIVDNLLLKEFKTKNRKINKS